MKTRTVIAKSGETIICGVGERIEIVLPHETSESDLDITLDYDSDVKVIGDASGSFYSSNKDFTLNKDGSFTYVGEKEATVKFKATVKLGNSSNTK